LFYLKISKEAKKFWLQAAILDAAILNLKNLPMDFKGKDPWTQKIYKLEKSADSFDTKI